MSLSVSRTLLGLSLLALFTYTLFAGLEMPFRASMLPVLASGLALPLTLLAIYIEWKTDNETKIKPMNPVAIWPSQRARSQPTHSDVSGTFSYGSPV